MKHLLKKIFIRSSKIIMSLFYDKNYLKGKHFDENIDGWLWCWRNVFMQKIIGYNRNFPFPVTFRSEYGKWENIGTDINDMSNFQHFGCYFQSWNGTIEIGKGSYIAPNVGLITENHDIYNLDKHTEPQNIMLGYNCWVGMNSVILPGVELGPHTIVGAGSVVTKSYTEGYQVIAGSPAKVIKKLDKEKFISKEDIYDREV